MLVRETGNNFSDRFFDNGNIASFTQQLLRPDIAFVIKLAVATLGKFYAKPFGHGKAGQANVRATPSAQHQTEVKMKLYFVRHGQSEANIKHVFSNQGLKHPLTETGRRQTEDLATKLSKEAFDHIITSPILRAIETTQLLAKRLNHESYEVNELLREYSVGILEGKKDRYSWDLFFDVQRLWEDEKNENTRIPGGESLCEIQWRVRRFLGALSKKEYERVLIIGHGGLYCVGLPGVVKNLCYSFTNKNCIDNTDVIIVEEKNGVYTCLKWGKVEQF